MPFNGIYNPEQLALLSNVLDDHCAALGVERATPDHEDAVYLVLLLFSKGVRTPDELKTALDATPRGDERRRT